MRFLQFNMCGSLCNKGDVVGVVGAILNTILSFRPDIVSLNEACLAQVDRLWTLLKQNNVTMSGCFGATTGRSLCPGAEGQRWYGNAILSRGYGIGSPELIELPNRPEHPEKRRVVSMLTDPRGVRLHVSSTHLVPRAADEEYNSKQVTEVARIHNARAASGSAVMIGCDLNATPDQITEILSPGGHFRDVDFQDNEATYSTRKIDYLLLNRERFEHLSGDATTSSYSDHRPLRGRATFKLPAASRSAGRGIIT
jgi:endonuclease/exonuclease/phosphatase family metal-dependent hydrolase